MGLPVVPRDHHLTTERAPHIPVDARWSNTDQGVGPRSLSVSRALTRPNCVCWKYSRLRDLRFLALAEISMQSTVSC